MNPELKKKMKEKFESAIKANENNRFDVEAMHKERLEKIDEEIELLKYQRDLFK